ncbi:MAG TPA: glucoamylase family protein [Tepidisphaeraceae bacterium]|nr:glucoamylase family protein [Tepidisphaeraceae bacterium]
MPAESRALLYPLQGLLSLHQIAELSKLLESPTVAAWPDDLKQAVRDGSRRATERIRRIEKIGQSVEELAEMDFSFLFDREAKLFSIGFNVTDHRLDTSYYDLLASEARLGSYVTIATGQVSQEHWFAMGRRLTSADGMPALLSWSGSMFEYLMPLLVMPSYENSLLDRTYQAVVRRQIEYGRQRGVPWGVSESCYNATDRLLNYQYRAFGVPGLGLKRGLSEDMVVAPYACALGLMVFPEEACRNLRKIEEDGDNGAFGFFEAIDYTASRVPPGQRRVPIRCFMAHHQAMSLLALEYVLLNRRMQRRFLAEPLLRSADLLLQERVPAVLPSYPHAMEVSAVRLGVAKPQETFRVSTDPSARVPELHLLSNGSYHVAVTSAGGGYSRWRDMAVTRWSVDATCDNWGSFCYLRDLTRGQVWSASFQPTLRTGERYESIFTQAQAEFRRTDSHIDAHTQISVSPEDDIELRRITLTNHSKSVRDIELTTYAEVVLSAGPADATHPAFSKLFVQTQIDREREGIICTRRSRSIEEKPPWMFHMMVVRTEGAGDISFETDRARFIGRGRTLVSPAAMSNPGSLSNTDGAVLDPIVSIRRTVRLQPDESVVVDIVTGAAESKDALLALMGKYRDRHLASRVFELSITHSQVVLRQLNANEGEAQLYGRLAGSILYPSRWHRAMPSVLSENRRGQPGLWGYGISGDLPIVLVRIRDQAYLSLVRQALQAHAYWRAKGLIVDLIIWNENDSIYRQAMQDSIMSLISTGPSAGLVDRPGGIFVRRTDQIPPEDRVLFQEVARVVLSDDAGSFSDQIERSRYTEPRIPTLKPTARRPLALPAQFPPRDLAYFNGLGGFTHDGREYIIQLDDNHSTPMPWCNLIANEHFGTLTSESGSVYTWAENAHEFRLTPWYNDPITASSGEAIYIRDEESGNFWSPTPLPARGRGSYVTRHGFGYTVFEHVEDNIISDLIIYVAMDAPVKFARLRLTNRSGRTRKLSVTGYWEWVLAELRSHSMMHVLTEVDPQTNAILARNPYNTEFPNRVAFVDTSERSRTVTGDRTEFIGRNGSLAHPAAMRRARLSGRVGAGFDPCAAMQVPVELADGQEREIVFMIGAATNEDEARSLIYRFHGTSPARTALQAVWDYWGHTISAIHVETPDRAVDYMANGWLLYQALACRMWGRSGFYQSGGAFGFRDQLQDAMALLHPAPLLLRKHLVLASSRQFREGDVQHWWHPPTGRGVRTRISDDYLWLPYAVCRYVQATSDVGVLDEKTHFVEARTLHPEEESFYDLPRQADEQATLYEHCQRAINYGLRFGSHGLPLMGSGDWNDGMNRVGIHGKGESVWLAFFLYDVLMRFSDLAHRRNDATFADFCLMKATELRQHIESNGWDGEWYLRAFFDEGQPLGSSANEECQIDAIPQSWSVLSGAGSLERSRLAMQHVAERLVRTDARLIQLLDPPFDKMPFDPGYIKGYVPGVRENGGQYTHAAIWTTMAFAALGDAKRAWELLDMLNPICHARTPQEVFIYKVEPYVIAADVYSVPPHTGRGGWTWYTGSAGWMYRLITESLLGLHLHTDKLEIRPCIPPEWKSYKIDYRYRETFYHITVSNPAEGKNVVKVVFDGAEQQDKRIPLYDDRRDHNAEVVLG